MSAYRPKKGDWIIEAGPGGIQTGALGRVLCSGPKTYDVIWVGGSTSRYPHELRHIRPATDRDFTHHGSHHVEAITRDYEDALEERRTGQGVRRAGGW